MTWLLLALSISAAVQPILASRLIVLPPFVVTGLDFSNFDIADARRDMQEQAKFTKTKEYDHHSLFELKRHWDLAGGYDNGLSHFSAGMHLSVAEWGRFNYGAMGFGVGFGKFPVYERGSHNYVIKQETTVIFNLVSASYKIKYLPSLGMYWYADAAQIYDLRHNMPQSQFGFSLSRK